MGDRDAFGREKDENPLASLGWRGEETASSAHAPSGVPAPAPVSASRGAPSTIRVAAPTQTPRPELAPERPSRPRSPRRRRRRGAVFGIVGFVRGLILLGVLIAVGGGVLGALVDSGAKRADRFARSLSAAQPPSAADTPGQADAPPGTTKSKADAQTPASLPRGLTRTSLLRPAAFGKAIAKLRTGAYGRLTNMRAAPERIDVTMLTKDGRLRQVQITPGGAARVLGTSGGGGFGGAATMSLQGIAAGAPDPGRRRPAEAVGEPRELLVYSEFAGSPRWNVYFKGGQIFSADARGRITRRIG